MILACESQWNEKLIVRGDNVRHHIHAVAGFVEFDLSIDESEQGPIATRADIQACDKLCTTLADQNTAGRNKFTTKTFNPKSLANAVTAVANAALTFLMCHKSLSVRRFLTGVVQYS